MNHARIARAGNSPEVGCAKHGSRRAERGRIEQIERFGPRFDLSAPPIGTRRISARSTSRYEGPRTGLRDDDPIVNWGATANADVLNHWLGDRSTAEWELSRGGQLQSQRDQPGQRPIVAVDPRRLRWCRTRDDARHSPHRRDAARRQLLDPEAMDSSRYRAGRLRPPGATIASRTQRSSGCWLDRRDGGGRTKRSKAPRAWIVALSGRNRLHGFVEEVRVDGLMAQVRLRIGDQLLTAVITHDAVEELKLRRGDDAVAIVKATEVMIAREIEAASGLTSLPRRHSGDIAA